jgi:hypothetical protein
VTEGELLPTHIFCYDLHIFTKKKVSHLTYTEKKELEHVLGMVGGYVLEFSNRTFAEFFREVVGVNIDDARYLRASGSKANRMRAFWDVATKEQLQKLLKGLLETWHLHSQKKIPEPTKLLLTNINSRLAGNAKPAETQTGEKAQPIGEGVSRKLSERLIEITRLEPQTRGYALERFLKDLFDAYGLSARASFRLVGEQIDGSFLLHNETYLLEAKWQNPKIGVEELHAFHGKLKEKASWSRGLFVSISGFSDDGLAAFGKGKRLVCIDGFDLVEMLRRQLSVVDVLSAKVRKAAETGHPFVSVRDLFL